MDFKYKASALYVRIVQSFLAEKDISVEAINKKLSTPLKDQYADNEKIPLAQTLELWQIATELSNDQAFGLHAGFNAHLTDYGIFSHVIMNSPNLYEALQLIHSYRYLMNEAFESTLATQNEITDYQLNLNIEHPGIIQIIEFHFASIAQLGREISARNLRNNMHPTQLEFTHKPQTSITEYERIFGCKVLFEQPHNRILIPYDVLQTPTHAPNKGLYSLLLNQVDSLYRSELNQNAYTHRVFHILSAEEQRSAWPTLEEMAVVLDTSPSTLKRRLKDEGSSYQTICDDIRYKQAKKMLIAKQCLAGEIAKQLGFSSPAAFTRSFKRWSGMTPKEYLNFTGKKAGN